MNKINDDLWRTMEEPDIDPLMAQGLKSSPRFRDWWTCRFYPDVKLGKLLEVEPNDWRKEWTNQVGRWRETGSPRRVSGHARETLCDSDREQSSCSGW